MSPSRTPILVTLGVATAVSLAGCHRPRVASPRGTCTEATTLDPARLREIAVANDRRYDDGIRRRDLDALVDIYTDDARYLPDRRGISSGRQAIREEWARALREVDLRALSLSPDHVGGSADVIYETGTGVTTFQEPAKPGLSYFHFKYVNVWVRQDDGSYRNAVDIYNDVPDGQRLTDTP